MIHTVASSPELLALASTPEPLNLVFAPEPLARPFSPELLALTSTTEPLNLVFAPEPLARPFSPDLLDLPSSPEGPNLVFAPESPETRDVAQTLVSAAPRLVSALYPSQSSHKPRKSKSPFFSTTSKIQFNPARNLSPKLEP